MNGKHSFTKEAYQYFKYRNYKAALDAYSNASEHIGLDFFYANIEVCKNNILKERNKYLPGNELSIVYASDNNYAKYLSVSIISVLKNNTNIKLKIYILIDNKFSNENKNVIVNISQKYSNCTIIFIDMDNKFRHIDMRIKHISFVTYYRLILASIIEEKRILYLDVDTVCTANLEFFVHLDIQQYYLAGVKAAGYHIDSKKNCDRLNIKTTNSYINAGVMLMNLEKIREDNLEEKFIALLKKNYSSQDQDILNVACFGMIKIINLKFNVMTTYFGENNKQDLFIEKDIFTKYEIEEAKYYPIIVHYATKNKPWNSSIAFDSYFWHYSYDSPYHLSLLESRYGRDRYEVLKRLNPVFYEEVIQKIYNEKMHIKLDLHNPQSYNEKIQWQKLYDKDKKRTIFSDKYLVREFVERKIGNKYLIRLLGVWDNFFDIDFGVLPNKFVLKTNHGCGWNAIITDKSKINYQELKEKFDKWMSLNFAYRVALELQYKDIQPKIIAEEYLENKDGDIYDYKIFCFNGKPKYIMFLSERKKGLKMAFYDLDWNKLPMVYSYPRNEEDIKKPKCLNELLYLAEKLASGFPHVRVDFYITNDGKIKFGEMTFTSASGFCKWNENKYDLLFGSHFDLPKIKTNVSVSIIVTAFNCEKYIKKSIFSLSNQTFDDIEIIIINDGSTDNTLNKIKNMQLFDKRIICITTQNMGAGAARNEGLKYATGDYVLFLDGDDFFEYDMVEKAYTKCIINQLDFVVFRSNKYDVRTKNFIQTNWTIKNNLLPTNRPFSQSDIKCDLFGCFNGWAWDKMYNRSFIKKNNIAFQEIRHNNDMAFVYKCLLNADMIDTIDLCLVHHNVGISSSLSNTIYKKPESSIIALQNIYEYIISDDKFKHRIVDFYSLAVRLINHHIKKLPLYCHKRYKSCIKKNNHILPKYIKDFSYINVESYTNIINFLQ